MKARRRQRPEDDLQRAVVEMAGWFYPRLFVFHPPNGGARTAAEAGVFKALGVRAGVPDLIVLGPGAVVGFLELKAPGGRLSPWQEHCMDVLEKMGFFVWVVRSVDQAVDAFDWIERESARRRSEGHE